MFWLGSAVYHVWASRRLDPCAARRYKSGRTSCFESWAIRYRIEVEMESDCQFLVVQPQPHRSYDAAAVDDGQFSRQLSGGDGAAAGRGAGGGERKRRFTEEQVRSLETTFHGRRAKLEPREKAELARELGLQPRQVTIWFQNKRARWRSKQLEQDYAALRAQYDALHARVASIKQEKLTLAAQLEDLRAKLNERQDQSGSCDGANNVSGCLVEDDEGAAPVVDVSEETAAGGYEYDHLAYGGGLQEPFCATPELWETWPPVEWNAVA